VVTAETAVLVELVPKAAFALALLVVPREVYISYDATGAAGLAGISRDDMAHLSFVLQGAGLALVSASVAGYAVYRSGSSAAAHNACLAAAAIHLLHIPYALFSILPKLSALGLPESVVYTNLAVWCTQFTVNVLALNGDYTLHRGPRYADFLDVPLTLWAVRAAIAASLFWGLLFVVAPDQVPSVFGLDKEGASQLSATVLKHLSPTFPSIGWAYLAHAATLVAAAVSYDRHTVYSQCFYLVVYYSMSFAANCVEKTAYYKLGFATDGILFTALVCAGIAFVGILGISTADAASRSPTKDQKHFA